MFIPLTLRWPHHMTTGRAFRSLLTRLQPRLDEPVHRSVPYSLSYVQRPARASCLMPPPQGSATASAYSTSIGPGSRLRRGSCSVRHRQQEHRSPSWPRSERKTGQKGIISCITEAPDQTTYACGSYSKSIGCVLRGIIDRLIAISLFHSIPNPTHSIYDHRSSVPVAQFPMPTGITQLAYSPDGCAPSYC